MPMPPRSTSGATRCACSAAKSSPQCRVCLPQARRPEVSALRPEALVVKEVVGNLTVENRVLVEKYDLPGPREQAVADVIERDTHRC
jgi:hypothetical protein